MPYILDYPDASGYNSKMIVMQNLDSESLPKPTSFAECSRGTGDNSVAGVSENPMALFVGNFDAGSTLTKDFKGYYFTTSDGSTLLDSNYEALGLAYEAADKMSLIIKLNDRVFSITAYNSGHIIKEVDTFLASSFSGISFAVGSELYYMIQSGFNTNIVLS